MSEMDVLSKMFDMHIEECNKREIRHEKSFGEIKDMFKGIWDAHDEMRKIVTSMQIKIALAIGGLIVLSKAADYFIASIR